MEPSFVVIDDFYSDPDQVRRRALDCRYRVTGRNQGYNGLVAEPGTAFVRRVMDRIARALKRDISYNLKAQGHFKVLTKSQFRKKETLVHVDYHRWSGVLCLTPPPLPLGATTFWRHRKTGLYGFHDVDAMWKVCRKLRLSADDLWKMLLEDTAKLSRWEEVSRISYVYNRLILFNGNLFHVSGRGFGTRLSDSKLTQTFFFEERTPKARAGCPPEYWAHSRTAARSMTQRGMV